MIVRQNVDGEVREQVRIDNDPMALAWAVEKAGPDPEVVLEATYGWYWAVDVLQAAGARVHLAHPLGVQGWAHRRVKNDELDERLARIAEEQTSTGPFRAKVFVEAPEKSDPLQAIADAGIDDARSNRLVVLGPRTYVFLNGIDADTSRPCTLLLAWATNV